MNYTGRYFQEKRKGQQKGALVAIVVMGLFFLALVPATVHYEKSDTRQPFSFIATVYAYSSEERQTDSSPTITASNKKVRDGIVANNCLPYGTLVRIAGRVFQVEDRMNPRYDCTVFDIWHASTDSAWAWGKQLLEVEIIK